MLRLKFSALVSIFTLALLPPVALCSPEPTRIVGTDMLAAEMTRELNSFAKRNDLDIRLRLQGSEPALHSLKDNEAELGIVIAGPNLTAIDTAEFIVRPAAYQTAVVVVPAGLSISQITYDQLSGIYNEGATSSFRRWADLNVSGPGAQRTLQPLAVDTRASLSFDLLRSVAFAGISTLKPSVTFADNAASALARLASAESGIAILPLPPPSSSKYKTLLVAAQRGDTAYPPTAENLHSGSYPFRLPVQFVFRKNNATRLRPVLRELLSEDAEKMWLAAGFIPLPVSVRNQLVFELETLQ